MDRYLNAFQVEFSEFTAELYEVRPQPTAEGDALFSVLNEHAMQLCRQVGGYAHYYRLGETWYAAVIGARKRSTVLESVDHTDLQYHDEITLDSGREWDLRLLKRVFFDSLSDHLERENEYWLDDRSNSKRVYATEPEQHIRGFDVYPGAKLRLDGEEGLTLAIDPTLGVRGENTLADFLDDSITVEEILHGMDSRYLFEKDDQGTVDIVDILDEFVDEYELDDGRTVMEYARQEYSERYAGRIDPDEPTVLVSYGSGRNYPAAPSLLRHAPVDERPDEVSQAATFDPDERWRRTEQFREAVEQFEAGEVSIEVDAEPLERDSLHYGYPVLTFGSEETVEMAVGKKNQTRKDQKITEEYWNPIKRGYVEKYGPSKPVRGEIDTAVVFPEQYADDALELYEDLREYASDNLELSLTNRPAEFAIDKTSDMEELRERAERFDAVIGFLAEYDEKAYHELIGDVDGRPLQVVTRKKLLSKSRSDVVQNTAAGLAAKLDVVPFALKQGQLSTQAYLGLNVDGGERGTASAVVISGETNEILYRTEDQEPTGGSTVVGADRAKRIVRDAIRAVLKQDNGIDTLESLTVHRNGFFGNDETEGIEAGIDQLRDRGLLPDDFQWIGVEVTHNSPHRLYDDEGMPQMGSQAQLGEDTVVVVTTDTEDLRQGSPQTLRCRIAAGSDDFDAYEVGRDVFLLSELNWGSPSKGTKDPITVLLTRRMNERLGHHAVSKLRYPPF